MAEEIDVENGRNSNFEGLVTLTFDKAIPHTVVHHSSTWPWPSIGPYGISSCISHRPLPIYQISFKLKKLFVDGRTDISPFYIIRSTLGSRPKNLQHLNNNNETHKLWEITHLLHAQFSECLGKTHNIQTYCSFTVVSSTTLQLHQKPWQNDLE